VRQHILDFQTEHKLKPKNGGAEFYKFIRARAWARARARKNNS
jgi:hypothetical protein